jgi:PKD repeat protein
MSKNLKLSLVIALIFVLGVPFVFAKGTERRSKSIPVSFEVPAVDMPAGPQRVITERPAVARRYQISCEDIDPQVGTIIQHDQVGSTYYEYQQVGSMGRMIAVTDSGQREVAFMNLPSPPSDAPRWVTYNCKDALGVWCGTKDVDGGEDNNAGYCNIAAMHDGREVIIHHRLHPTLNPWKTTLAVGDPGRVCSSQNTFFYKYDVPDSLGQQYGGTWPKMGIVYNESTGIDYMHIVMTQIVISGGNRRLGYLRCHLIDGDTLLCEIPTGQPGVVSPVIVPPNTQLVPNKNVACFGEVEAPGVPPGEYPNTVSVIFVTSPVSHKVAIVFTNKRQAGTIQMNNDVFYFESTDNGNEWFPQFGGVWPPTLANGMLHNITNYPTDATERAYTDVAACYDYNDSLHIIWNTLWYDSAQGLVSIDANFYHWSKATGISLIAEGYWGGTDPGAWNLNISKMSIAAMDPVYRPGGDPDSVYLYCIWTQFDSADNSANGYTNGDIYGAGSLDGGATWGFPYNLTNTKTPGCIAGECLSEHWSSLAQNLHNGNLHIQYVCDRDPGGAVVWEGEWTDNPVMYLELQAWDPLYGVLIASFSAQPESGFRPLTVQFTDSTIGDPTSLFWDFGDGNTDTVQNPIHTYNDTGYFDVKLIVSDSVHSDTIIKPDYIAVFETLTVDFSAQPTHGRKPLTVSFQSILNEVPDSLTWYFGGGQTNNQLNPVHKYTAFGSYDVKLVAELCGYKDSLTKEDYVQVTDIQAEFMSDKRCGSAPLLVAFSDSSTGTFPIIAWHWDFGDGDTSNQPNPTHQFTSSGVFNIALVVSDSIGADTLTKQDYITTQDSVSADFFGLPNSGRSPLTVMFEPILEGIANYYLWDFGDGDTSTLRNPIHIYTNQGEYDVKLKVRLELDDCNQVDSMMKEEYIIVNDLEARFSAHPTAGIAPLSVQFTDESSGSPSSWFWDFGDGHTSTQQNPQNQYATTGVYDVFLRVSNSMGVDSLLKLDYILVTDSLYADLFAEIYGPGGARPGFDFWFYCVWTNIGSNSAQNCTLKILRPPEMTFYDVYPGYIRAGTYSGYSFSEDTIIVPLQTINPSDWYGGYVYVYGNLPASVPVGDTLICQMWLTSSTPEWNYDDNYVLFRQVVTGSIDPNDKLASPEGEGISHAIKPDQRLSYTIRFENKPEATAEAIYIRVVDTLDYDLNWGSLAIGAMSHSDKCHYQFDPYTGVIVWSCDSIMLPPNHNPPEGEGYFTYSISPKPDLPNGRELTNTSWIRFDYNAWLQAPEEGPVIRTIKYPFIYGDVNGDGIINVSDVVYLINYLFIGGPAPNPLAAGDANCDGVVNASDVVYLINYLFIGGPEPNC